MIEEAIARNLIPFVAIMTFAIWMITLSVTENWSKVRIAEQNAVLKKDMIERGLHPDEIVRIISASPGKRCKISRSSSDSV